MKDLQQILFNNCYSQDLEQRKHWYSTAAAAYYQARPRYPQAFIAQVVDLANITLTSTVLEVGCGSAIATSAFAALGCPMVCIEPNPDFYHLARQVCAPCPKVEVQNCAFEEWELAPQSFDAVLAASSFHWIAPKIGYPKAAAALRSDGYLILLWNKELQPRYEVYQQLSAVESAGGRPPYRYFLNRPYEDCATQVAILDELGQMAVQSGYFKDMISGHVVTEVTYSIDLYLLLLSTYSPYVKLEPQQQQALFSDMRQVLTQHGDTVQLSYVSAFHLARPI